MLKWIKNRFKKDSKEKDLDRDIDSLEKKSDENKEDFNEIEKKSDKNDLVFKANLEKEDGLVVEEKLEGTSTEDKLIKEEEEKAKELNEENQEDTVEDLELANELEEKSKQVEEIKKEKENLQEEIKLEDKIIDDEKVDKLEKSLSSDKIEVEEEVEEELDSKSKKKSWFSRLTEGLTKTRENISGRIDDILFNSNKIDEELYEELEEILITSDVGVKTTMELIDNLRERVKEEKTNNPEDIKELLKNEMIKIMDTGESNKLNIEPGPAVILVVGVNGVGKTTTIGKISNRFKEEGKSVLIAAGDTFRAAAIEQLEEWGNRSNVDVISHSEGADPAAVIFDGIQAAKSRGTDILICDTAGRLHNKSNLMQELNKIFRVIDKEFEEAKKEVLLVLDATTGQNAINQAKEFKEVANITGVALTKLDGTAKGGVVLALESELKLPVKLVGVGEGIDDLQDFNSKEFIDAIFS